MNCATHPEVSAVAFCRACGKALCSGCRQEWQGVVYCDACSAAQQASAPRQVAARPVTQPDNAGSAGLAFFLGLIPGVGAIYNGQYAKGILHVVVLGLLISIANSHAADTELQPLIVMFIFGWFFYMAFEAYHTAKRRLAGEPVEEFSGLLRTAGQPGTAPVGPIILIGLGVVFLMHTLGVWRMEQILKFWPVLLIAAGVYLLYGRLAARPEAPPRPAESAPKQADAREE